MVSKHLKNPPLGNDELLCGFGIWRDGKEFMEDPLNCNRFMLESCWVAGPRKEEHQ